jgi:hypothetical protein
MALATVAAPLIPPAKGLTETIDIRADDKAMAVLDPLLATDADDRLQVGLPKGMTDQQFLAAIYNNDFDAFKGYWPYTPPSGDPAKITKADYLAVLKDSPGTKFYESNFNHPNDTPNCNPDEPICIFMALYKGTGDRKYLEMAINAVKAFCAGVDKEVAANPTKAPYPSSYWTWAYAYVTIPLFELKGTPEFDTLMTLVGKALARRAAAWPVAPEHGPQNRAIDPAFWYDIALRWGADQIPAEKAAQLRARVDQVWKECTIYHDITEDDSWYSLGDYLVLHAWYQVRGEQWWDTPDHAMFFTQYAEQPCNDGMWPMYGDGGSAGKFFAGALVGEVAARYLRNGKYKWLARRAFWNGKDRLPKLCANIGYQNLQFLAMACLNADETVKAVPPTAGAVLTTRRLRELVPSEIRLKGEPWYVMHPEAVPSKVMLRAGSTERDHCLLLQAGQMADHGHPDSGQIIHYGGDGAAFLYNAAIRLDTWTEAHNTFVLRDPAQGKYWPGQWCGTYTSEGITVPVLGATGEASYARLHIGEYPGVTPTAELWQTVRTWKKNWTLEKAIGYKNWPVRLDRSVLFVNNKFTVVRDVTHWTLPASAQMGPNWTFGELGSAGTHWVNTWAPKVMDGHYSYRTPKGGFFSPVETAPMDLLIWFVPQQDAVMQVEKVVGDRSTTNLYSNAHYNAPLRAWYTRTGDWTSDAPQAFTTVLYPHTPGSDAAKLADNITVVKDSADLTIIKITEGDTQRVIALSSGNSMAVDKLSTDADAALLTYRQGKLQHLSLWHCRQAKFGATVLVKSAKPIDTEKHLGK